MSTGASERASLAERAAACDRELERYDGLDDAHVRARAILSGTAEVCRQTAALFALDPTLVDEPDETGRLRWIYLVVEIARQIPAFLRGSVFSTHPRITAPLHERWEEVEAMYQRLQELGRQARYVVRYTSTAAGREIVSAARLAARSSSVRDAAESLRYAVASALQLADPHPRAVKLAALADSLDRRAARLAKDHEANLAEYA
jgi:hypothetical protein